MGTLNKAKQKEPKAKGLGNKPRTSDSLNDEEIEKLYASKCLVKPSSHYKQFVAKFDLTFQPSRRQTDRESDAGEMSNPGKRQTEKSICCMGFFSHYTPIQLFFELSGQQFISLTNTPPRCTDGLTLLIS